MSTMRQAVPGARHVAHGAGAGGRGIPAGGERGATMMELLVMTAVGAMVATVLMASLSLLWSGVRFQRAALVASDEVVRAARAITKDLQMAESTDLADQGSASAITLTYTNRATGDPVTVVYQLTGAALTRTVNGGATQTLARNVTELGFTRDGGLYTVTVTSEYEGNADAAVRSEWKVYPRPTG